MKISSDTNMLARAVMFLGISIVRAACVMRGTGQSGQAAMDVTVAEANKYFDQLNTMSE